MLRRIVARALRNRMASNRFDSDQSRSSQPPANITSCLLCWICSAELPMQWLEVAQAEEIE